MNAWIANLQDVPVGIVLLGFVLAWLLVRLAELGVDGILRRRGLPTGDHCEHCGEVEALRDQLTTLSEIGHDSFAVLEEIRDALGEVEPAAHHASDTRTSAIPTVPPCTAKAVRPYVL